MQLLDSSTGRMNYTICFLLWTSRILKSSSIFAKSYSRHSVSSSFTTVFSSSSTPTKSSNTWSKIVRELCASSSFAKIAFSFCFRFRWGLKKQGAKIVLNTSGEHPFASLFFTYVRQSSMWWLSTRALTTWAKKGSSWCTKSQWVGARLRTRLA